MAPHASVQRGRAMLDCCRSVGVEAEGDEVISEISKIDNFCEDLEFA